jgi:hypothetical protein
MRWLSTHTPHIRSLSLHTRFVRANGNVASLQPEFTFAPAVGKHLIRYRTSWLLIERKRERAVSSNTGNTVTATAPWETLTLTTLGG